MIVKVSITDYSFATNIALDSILSVSIAVSIAFTFNIVISIKRNSIIITQEADTINNNIVQIQGLENIIENYEKQLSHFSYKETHLIDNTSVPNLAIMLVPYRIKGSFFPMQHEEDYVEFVDKSIKEIDGRTYYCYINGTYVNFSLHKERIIEEYFHDTMETKKVQNGTALVSKPRHLVVFKLINVGSEAATSVYPVITPHDDECTYKGIQPTILKVNEELLFVVLVELQGQSTIKYNFAFEYFHKGKHYTQSVPVTLNNDELEFVTELSEPSIIPALVNNVL